MMKFIFKLEKVLFTSIFLFGIFLFNLSSENFSITKKNDVSFSDVTETVKFKIGVNDAIHINLPKDMTYVCGLEINLKIPEEIAAWRDSIAYSLYEDVKTKNENYSGRRISYATIPGRLSLNVYIALTDEFKIKDSPYAERIPVTPKLTNNDVFFRLQLVMKEVPDFFENAELDATVRPVLIEKGMLNLSVENAKQTNLPTLSKKKETNISKNLKTKNQSYTVYIDDKQITSFSNLYLPLGEHHASIVSDNYRNELRTFIIEQAKTTNLSVELRSIEPTLIFICPVNTVIYFDDKLIENPKTAFIIEPGEHSAKMIVGDYEIVKNFTATNGKSYSMSLDIDASIYEEK